MPISPNTPPTPQNDPQYNKVFQSSNPLSGSYDPQTQTLTVWFGQGQQYEYSFVPEEVWFRLTQAVSPGRFFHASIRPNYIGKQIA